MKKVFLLIAGVVGICLLTGCEGSSSSGSPHIKYDTTIDECTVKYVNNPRGHDFFIAKCPSESFTTTYNTGGKSSRPVATVVTSDQLRKQLDDVEAKEKALAKLSDAEKKLLGIE